MGMGLREGRSGSAISRNLEGANRGAWETGNRQRRHPEGVRC